MRRLRTAKREARHEMARHNEALRRGLHLPITPLHPPRPLTTPIAEKACAPLGKTDAECWRALGIIRSPAPWLLASAADPQGAPTICGRRSSPFGPDEVGMEHQESSGERSSPERCPTRRIHKRRTLCLVNRLMHAVNLDTDRGPARRRPAGSPRCWHPTA
jgi:hypothetical protein